MKLSQAKEIAEYIRSRFEPYCEKIIIGGSIRRMRPEVKDIEIICVPKMAKIGLFQDEVIPEERELDMFFPTY